jgi:hypothetical protein
MYGPMPPFPSTSTWHGTSLSIKLNLPFTISSFLLLQKLNPNLQLYLQRTGSIESGKLAAGICGVSA